MCGIWAVYRKNNTIKNPELLAVMRQLMTLSEERGKEASGIAAMSDGEIKIIRRSVPATQLMKTSDYQTFVRLSIPKEDPVFVMGHSRLVTNGAAARNNQPVIRGSMAMVHNGIIVNDARLWEKNPDLKRRLEVDTEILLALIQKYKTPRRGTAKAVKKAYSDIYGMASTITADSAASEIIACSNNGSLYYYDCEDYAIIASERLTVEKLLSEMISEKAGIQKAKTAIVQLNYGESFIWKMPVSEKGAATKTVKVNDEKQKPEENTPNFNFTDFDDYDIDTDRIRKIRRCTRCILPETMPYIEFDEEGICNYCRTYEKRIYPSKEEFDAEIDRLKSSPKPFMVSFSGGRDSSYGLHFFAKELGLKTVTYCYDWGMVTDLARRNQSRMCSKLGVEFILVSADIRKKRDNIRRNVEAWMKRPDLGMIPLFMAGDKQFFYYANKVCSEYGLDEILLAMNPLEKTHFKSGFAGAKPKVLLNRGDVGTVEGLHPKGIIDMTGYYLGQYIKNPAYINRSVIDTIGATVSYYGISHKHFRLFDYMKWDEETVNKTLRDEYDWELAPDTATTWRIGDGTAPWYNYIYYAVAGFTENDTLRSNQIREGQITRDTALMLAERDNIPRWDSMKWYFDTINVSMEDALKAVKGMPKLYETAD